MVSFKLLVRFFPARISHCDHIAVSKFTFYCILVLVTRLYPQWFELDHCIIWLITQLRYLVNFIGVYISLLSVNLVSLPLSRYMSFIYSNMNLFINILKPIFFSNTLKQVVWYNRLLLLNHIFSHVHLQLIIISILDFCDKSPLT